MKKSSHNRRRRPDASGHAEGADDGDVSQPLAMAVGGHEHDAAAIEADDALPDLAAHLIERLRPHLVTILGVGATALVALVALLMMSAQRESLRAESWDACMVALSSGDQSAFDEVARRYPGTDAARWAELLTADGAAAEGADLLFVDRQRAEGRLRAAIDMYSAIMASRPRGLLGERTTFGLAKARESLGILDESRRGYESVAVEYAGDAIAKLAGARAADLGREATRQWYDWFAAQKPIAPGGTAGVSETRASPPVGSGPDKPANVDSQPAPAAGQP